jgi:hypothetical protein
MWRETDWALMCAVAQLVEMCYNPEGRGLIPDCVIGIFH